MKVLLYIVIGILFVAVAVVIVFLPESYAGMASETLHFAHKRVKDFQTLVAGILAAAAGSLVYFAAKAQINEQRNMEEQRKKDEKDALANALVAEIINIIRLCYDYAKGIYCEHINLNDPSKTDLENWHDLLVARYIKRGKVISLPYSMAIYEKNSDKIGILPKSFARNIIYLYGTFQQYKFAMEMENFDKHIGKLRNMSDEEFRVNLTKAFVITIKQLFDAIKNDSSNIQSLRDNNAYQISNDYLPNPYRGLLEHIEKDFVKSDALGEYPELKKDIEDEIQKCHEAVYSLYFPSPQSPT